VGGGGADHPRQLEERRDRTRGGLDARSGAGEPRTTANQTGRRLLLNESSSKAIGGNGTRTVPGATRYQHGGSIGEEYGGIDMLRSPSTAGRPWPACSERGSPSAPSSSLSRRARALGRGGFAPCPAPLPPPPPPPCGRTPSTCPGGLRGRGREGGEAGGWKRTESRKKKAACSRPALEEQGMPGPTSQTGRTRFYLIKISIYVLFVARDVRARDPRAPRHGTWGCWLAWHPAALLLTTPRRRNCTSTS
jgi:hypothetical protein